MKKHYLLYFIVFGVVFTMVCQATAGDKTITFATEEWKDATHRDGSGLYWDILRAVYEPQGYKIKPVIRSYKGSVILLETQKVDAMIGAYGGEIGQAVYPTNHFAVDIVLAVYRQKSDFQWTGMDTILGKKVGWVDGYFYHEYLPESVVKSMTIRRVDSRETGFRLLNLSHLDFMIDAQGDVKDFFEDNPEYHLNDFQMKEILEQKLYVVFQASTKGVTLSRVFDQAFLNLLKTGQIKKMYDSYSHSNFTIPSDFLN